jgi:hypothetical protein
MGNGPSLNNVNIDDLRDIDTFSVNRAFTSYEEWGFNPTYYCIIDGRSIRSTLDGIVNLIKTNKEIKHFFINNSKNEFDFGDYCDRVSIIKDFGSSVKHNQWGGKIPKEITTLPTQGSVVPYVIQIAISMGYTDIGLVGVDARYVKREDVKIVGKYVGGPKRGQDKIIFTSDNDPNHYHKGYHGEGHETSKIHLKDVAGNDLNPYKSVNIYSKKNNVKLISCTENSRINGFIPYIKLCDFL